MLKDLATLRYAAKSLFTCLCILIIQNTSSAEGTKQVSPLPEDIVILNIYQEGFANFGTHGTAKAMSFSIKDASETVYIGLSQLVNSNGQIVSKDFSFRIIDPAGNIVHGPFQVNATNANGDLYTEIVNGPDLDGSGNGYNISDSRFVFSPNATGDFTIEFEQEDGGTTAYGPKHWDISVADSDSNVVKKILAGKIEIKTVGFFCE